jgi:threonylcarbamoyladenosine tRNA methylthiotransferase MtaB
MKVFIYTLGCKVNEVDSELYAQEMRLLGAEMTTALTEADAVIVNSCSVTNRAQAQSLQFARRAVRERPGAPVYLTGCGAALLNLTRTGAPVGVTVVAMSDRAEVARLVVGSGDAVQTAARALATAWMCAFRRAATTCAPIASYRLCVARDWNPSRSILQWERS